MASVEGTSVTLSSQSWTGVSVDRMHLAFLRSDWDKLCFGGNEVSRSLIDEPDLSSPEQNLRRRDLLYSGRAQLLVKVPPDTQWYEVRYLCEPHLNELLVIGRCGWDSNRDGNQLLQVASRRNDELQGSPENWESPVLWGHSFAGPFTILEGNHRLVAYARSAPRPELKIVACIGLSPTKCFWHLPDLF